MLDNTIKATRFAVVIIPLLTEQCQEAKLSVSHLLETILLKTQLPHIFSAASNACVKQTSLLYLLTAYHEAVLEWMNRIPFGEN